MRRPPRVERLACGLVLLLALGPVTSAQRIPIPKPDVDPTPPDIDPPKIDPPDITPPDLDPLPGEGGGGSGGTDGGSDPPFSDTKPEGDDEELKKAIESLLDQLTSLAGALSTSSGAPTVSIPGASGSTSAAAPAPTAAPNGVNATLGCQIYQAYSSLCPPLDVGVSIPSIIQPTALLTFHDIEPSVHSIIQPTALPSFHDIQVSIPSIVHITARDFSITTTQSQSTDEWLASCVCYSSTYYVPDVYDAALAACANYVTAASGAGTASTTTSLASELASEASAAAAQGIDFCARVGNVRNSAQTATFGEFSATMATAAPTTATPSAATSASGGDASRGAGHGMWFGAVVGALMAAVSVLM